MYINNVLAAVGDQIAAYSGNEVRGIGRIGANGRVTLGVNIASVGERITFKVWDASEGDNGTILNCLQSLSGSNEPQGTAANPFRIDAASSDPFGNVVTEPLVPPTIMEALVTVDGVPASAGDILAVFSGNMIVGKAAIEYSNQNGVAKATCRPVMFFSGSKTLSFKLWDADAEAVLESSFTVTAASGDIIGSVTSPRRVAFSSATDDVPCPVSLKSGWNLVSFSALPDSPTPQSVFSPVASSIRYVSDVAGNLWMPNASNNGISTLRRGVGYWVNSSANNVNWDVAGRVDTETEISLSQGWNLIGYTLPRAGNIADVLRTAIATGKVQYIADQAGNVYPGGALSNMRPGVGYWLRATGAFTLKFDRTGMSTTLAALSMVESADDVSHPFGTPVIRVGTPTVFQNVSVTLFGKPAAFGDYLAVYDNSTGELLSVQPIQSEDGTLTFTIMSLRSGDRLNFKVWNAASGLQTPEILAADSSSSITLTATQVDEGVVGHAVTVSGMKPSYTVTYNLDGKGTRTGGGALTQTIQFGGNAVDPVVTGNAGWRFVDWDYSKRTDIRGPMTITALYEADNTSPTPSSIAISGSSSVNSGGSATYTCTATMSNGSTKTVTPTWMIDSGSSYASINSSGTLTAYSTTVQRSVTVKASYTEGGVTKTTTKTVTINAATPPPTPAPANDNFASATVISGASGSTAGSNVGATIEVGEPMSYGTVWYKWTAPSSVTMVTFNSLGSDFDTILGVYLGSSVSALTEVAYNDDAGDGDFTSEVSVNVTPGNTYMIAICGYGGDEGTVRLNWSTASSPTPTPTPTTPFGPGNGSRFSIDEGVEAHVVGVYGLTGSDFVQRGGDFRVFADSRVVDCEKGSGADAYDHYDCVYYSDLDALVWAGWSQYAGYT
ncbi:MAG: hypothetical protein IJI36_15315, partial [Kiritimatiellae bacterium]|nr:hypothetical protein [Kiritimatiellia bacterium]